MANRGTTHHSSKWRLATIARPCDVGTWARVVVRERKEDAPGRIRVPIHALDVHGGAHHVMYSAAARGSGRDTRVQMH